MSRLEQLAEESPILKNVLAGETTYNQEVGKYRETYHPSVKGKLKNIVGRLNYNQQHFSRLVTDLNKLTEILYLEGDPLPGLTEIEKVSPKLISPAEWPPNHCIQRAGMAGLLSLTIGYLYTQKGDVDISTPVMLGCALLAFGLSLIGFYLVDGYSNPDFQRLYHWSSRVDMKLKERMERGL